MKRNTLEKLRDCLRDLEPRVEIAPGYSAARRAAHRADARGKVMPSCSSTHSAAAHEPAHQRHRPVQYPVLLLHAREGSLRRAGRDSHLRRNRACRRVIARSRGRQDTVTGGEPLVRKNLARLIEASRRSRRLPIWRSRPTECCSARKPRICMMRDCGASTCIWIRSTATRFEQITRRDEFDRVMAGIEACLALGLSREDQCCRAERR